MTLAIHRPNQEAELAHGVVGEEVLGGGQPLRDERLRVDEMGRFHIIAREAIAGGAVVGLVAEPQPDHLPDVIVETEGGESPGRVVPGDPVADVPSVRVRVGRGA